MANKIGWCTSTLNPITGCTNCDENGFCQGKFRCYAEGFARRLAGKERKHPGSTGYPTEPGQHFCPTFHPEKLQDVLNLPRKGKPKRVFLDSMSDFFCEGVRPDWVHHIIDVLWQMPRHHFLVLTKRPERIMEVLHCRDLPPNLWLGVSVTCQADYWRIDKLKESIPSTTKRFVSFEPLLGPINLGSFGGVDWAIIGAQTGPGNIVPKPEWVADMLEAIPVCIPVFLKDSIRNAFQDQIFFEICGGQDFPKEMRR